MELNEKSYDFTTLSKFPNEPIKGTVKPTNMVTNHQGLFHAATPSADAYLDLSTGVDYEPAKPMRGFEIHGVQSDVVVMVEFMNGSIGRFGNITIAAGTGWWPVTGYWIKKILCAANGTTASGVVPIF